MEPLIYIGGVNDKKKHDRPDSINLYVFPDDFHIFINFFHMLLFEHELKKLSEISESKLLKKK